MVKVLIPSDETDSGETSGRKTYSQKDKEEAVRLMREDGYASAYLLSSAFKDDMQLKGIDVLGVEKHYARGMSVSEIEKQMPKGYDWASTPVGTAGCRYDNSVMSCVNYEKVPGEQFYETWQDENGDTIKVANSAITERMLKNG